MHPGPKKSNEEGQITLFSSLSGAVYLIPTDASADSPQNRRAWCPERLFNRP